MREYLRTSWSPDREFVDGRIEERNLGEKEHSILQRFLTVLFAIKQAEWGVEVFPELRTQTQARRFRVPDVLVTRAGDKFERYVTHPPLIAIEILSPEDTLRAMQEKLLSTGSSASSMSGSSIPSRASLIATPARLWKKNAPPNSRCQERRFAYR